MLVTSIMKKTTKRPTVTAQTKQQKLKLVKEVVRGQLSAVVGGAKMASRCKHN